MQQGQRQTHHAVVQTPHEVHDVGDNRLVEGEGVATVQRQRRVAVEFDALFILQVRGIQEEGEGISTATFLRFLRMYHGVRDCSQDQIQAHDLQRQSSARVARSKEAPPLRQDSGRALILLQK